MLTAWTRAVEQSERSLDDELEMPHEQHGRPRGLGSGFAIRHCQFRHGESALLLHTFKPQETAITLRNRLLLASSGCL